MSYQPYPGGTQMPEPAERPPVPQSITRAVQLMYAGAVASLLGIVIALTTLSSIKSQIISRNPSLTTTQVNNAEHVAIGILIASGLIGAALWLWMAQSSKAGKNWARIVSTVLFAIQTINVVAGASAVPTDMMAPPSPVLPGVVRRWVMDWGAAEGIEVERRMLSIDRNKPANQAI